MSTKGNINFAKDIRALEEEGIQNYFLDEAESKLRENSVALNSETRKVMRNLSSLVMYGEKKDKEGAFPSRSLFLNHQAGVYF